MLTVVPESLIALFLQMSSAVSADEDTAEYMAAQRMQVLFATMVPL